MIISKTIYYSDSAPLYGDFHKSFLNHETLQQKALFLDFNHSGAKIFRENESEIKKRLRRNGISLYVLNPNSLKQNKKLFYYYPEYKKIQFADVNIQTCEINNLILSGLNLDEFKIDKTGLIFPLDVNFSYSYNEGKSVYNYLFIDLSDITSYKELKETLSSSIPLITTDSYKDIYWGGPIGSIIKFLFYHGKEELIDLKRRIRNPFVDEDGFKKIYPNKETFLKHRKVETGPAYRLVGETDEEIIENNRNEFKFNEMLKVASSVKNEIELLAENGFEELALLAIIKAFKIDNESKMLQYKEKIEELKNLISEDLEKKWFADTEHILSRMTITKDYRIILDDYDIEIKLNPLHKSLYFVFLQNPEGMLLREIVNYKDELTDWYLKLSNRKISDNFDKSIEVLCNPFENSLYEKISRIKKEFVSQLDDKIAKLYYISSVGTYFPKKITIPRDLVIWEK